MIIVLHLRENRGSISTFHTELREETKKMLHSRYVFLFVIH